LAITAEDVDRRARLLGAAAVSREAELAWLVGAVFIGANQLLDDNLKVRSEFAPLVQSYELRTGKEGLTVKVTMPPKLQALRTLAEMLGHVEPVKGEEDEHRRNAASSHQTYTGVAWGRGERRGVGGARGFVERQPPRQVVKG